MFERKDSIFKKSEKEDPSKGVVLASAPAPGKKTVFIGQSIFIKGELTGNEDLTIEGKVVGNIELKDHNVTIGSNGRIEAEICARNITIMGEVQGNVFALEKVEIARTGRLIGNMTAPRVVIEDGARFKGSVEMESQKPVQQSETGKKAKRDVSHPSAGSLSMSSRSEQVVETA